MKGYILYNPIYMKSWKVIKSRQVIAKGEDYREGSDCKKASENFLEL